MRLATKVKAKSAAICGSVAAAILVFAAPSHAWENDVHYGLTRWLAVQVGFSAEQAEWVASGDQGVDDSNVTGPVISTAISSCVATDAAGSATVAKNHFPARVLPPAPAASRVVAHGEPWWETHRAPPPALDGSQGAFLSLGRYLHSLQDSWSHQGEPDIPLSCDPQYAWGHALARGGWSCHLADLTYKWVEPDVMPMARATFDTLAAALDKPPLHGWDALKGKVAEFARLDNKLGKERWLEQRGFANAQEIAYATSLKNCPAGQPRCVFDEAIDAALKQWNRRLGQLPPLSPDLPKELVTLLARFSEAMAKGDDKTLRALIDKELAQKAIDRALHINSYCADLFEEQFKWSLRDPFLQARGAQQPVAMCELAMQIQSHHERPGLECSVATKAAIMAYGEALPRGPNLQLLIDKLGSALKRPFAISAVRRAQDNDRDAEYWAHVHFPHLPQDRLLLGAARSGDGYKITAFAWEPQE